MKTDEESIVKHNMKVIASALLEVMNVFCKIEGCENKYIRDLGNDMLHKYGEQLKDITNNGKGVY